MPLIVGLRAHLAGLPSQVLLRTHRFIGRVQRGAVTTELQGARLEMQREAPPTVLARLAQRPLHASVKAFLQVEMGVPRPGERLQLLEVERRAGEHAHGRARAAGRMQRPAGV